MTVVFINLPDYFNDLLDKDKHVFIDDLDSVFTISDTFVTRIYIYNPEPSKEITEFVSKVRSSSNTEDASIIMISIPEYFLEWNLINLEGYIPLTDNAEILKCLVALG